MTRIELTKAKAQIANLKKRSAAQREEAQRTQYSTRLGVAILGVQRESARIAMVRSRFPSHPPEPCIIVSQDEAKKERNEAKKQREEAKRQRDEAKEQRDEARRQRDEARQQRDGLKKELYQAQTELGNALSQRDEAKEDKKALKKKLRAFVRGYDSLEFVASQLAQANKDARVYSFFSLFH